MLKTRMDLAVTKGCDGVEPDNMDGHTNDACFSLISDDQLKFNQAIANYSRSIGLSVGLKNDPDQVADLEPCFHLDSEQYFLYSHRIFKFLELELWKTTKQDTDF